MFFHQSGVPAAVTGRGEGRYGEYLVVRAYRLGGVTAGSALQGLTVSSQFLGKHKAAVHYLSRFVVPAPFG